jgi:hypothetical protein
LCRLIFILLLAAFTAAWASILKYAPVDFYFSAGAAFTAAWASN